MTESTVGEGPAHPYTPMTASHSALRMSPLLTNAAVTMQLYGGGAEAQLALSGVIIACILGTVMVLAYSVISLLVILR